MKVPSKSYEPTTNDPDINWIRDQQVRRRITISYIDTDPEIMAGHIVTGGDVVIPNQAIDQVKITTVSTVIHKRRKDLRHA